ncbi:hypothetical protein GUJ93_ZPchr0003g18152 [Zizania palustris]|uniref:Uncharacterized protein n=1 Tax=Zizania palustris TaxID=103762 RepID=A0A8J5RWA6_ZIZPA|nr:hypothetical protein GUJ93_ZPchr0003g18152 [Zizania palustris]
MSHISFTAEDAAGVKFPHADPLVISADIAGVECEDVPLEPVRLISSGPKPLHLYGLGLKDVDLRLKLVCSGSPSSKPLQLGNSGLEGVNLRDLGLECLGPCGPKEKSLDLRLQRPEPVDLGCLLPDQSLGGLSSPRELRSTALAVAVFGEQGQQRTLRQRDYLRTKWRVRKRKLGASPRVLQRNTWLAALSMARLRSMPSTWPSSSISPASRKRR